MIIETNTQYDMRAFRVALLMKEHYWVTDPEVRDSLDAPDTLPIGSVGSFAGFGLSLTARRDF